MEKWFDIAAALLLIFSAIFWFLSAYGKLPPIVTYWDQTPEADPFYKAVKFSAVMNRWAAGCSDVSALFMAARLCIGKL